MLRNKLSMVALLGMVLGCVNCWDPARGGWPPNGNTRPGGRLPPIQIPTTPPFNPHATYRPIYQKFKREADQLGLADLDVQLDGEDTGELLRLRRNYIRPTYRPPPTTPPRPIRVRRDLEEPTLVDLDQDYHHTEQQQLRFRRHYIKPTYKPPTVRPPPPVRPPRPMRV